MFGSAPAAAGTGFADADGRGFAALDAIVRRPDAAGLVFVHGAATVLDAVAAHAARRARGAGRAVVSVGRGPTDDAIRELCAQIAGSAPTDPLAAADSIAKGLAGTVAVVLDRAASAWGAAVLDALASAVPTDGENAPLVRERICEELGFLGIELDAGRNAKNASLISTDGGRVAVRVIRTDEEFMIARQVIRVLGLGAQKER